MNSYDNPAAAATAAEMSAHTGLDEDSRPAVHCRRSKRDCCRAGCFRLGARHRAARGCSDKEQT